MQNGTLAAIFRPTAKREALVYDLILVIGASIVLAISAQIAIPVPFSPVPITMQTLAVLLTGALLGPQLGTMAVITYLLEGIIGLPVFANAHAGLVTLMGPTGGYLLGFVPAAFVTGYLFEHSNSSSWVKTLVIMTLGTLLIFIYGLAWLAITLADGPILAIGLYPFLPGALLKILLASLFFRSGWRLTGLRR
jgi:biotin transport system substrate-specific component